MLPEETKSDSDHGDVQMKEGLVESMTDRRGGVSHQASEAHRSLDSLVILEVNSGSGKKKKKKTTYDQTRKQEAAHTKDLSNHLPTGWRKHEHMKAKINKDRKSVV